MEVASLLSKPEIHCIPQSSLQDYQRASPAEPTPRVSFSESIWHLVLNQESPMSAHPSPPGVGLGTQRPSDWICSSCVLRDFTDTSINVWTLSSYIRQKVTRSTISSWIFPFPPQAQSGSLYIWTSGHFVRLPSSPSPKGLRSWSKFCF